MTDDPTGHQLSRPPARSHRAKRWMERLLILLLFYAFAAYLLIPILWELYEHRHPAFDDDPRLTQTSDGHPGDPLNVALLGTAAQLKLAMQAAGWFPAAALGLGSDLKIAADSVLSRPDVAAPVSNLYLFGRKEDLAFEMPVGNNPRQRHHVRFWKTTDAVADGRPNWLGAASYDERIGLSRTTGQITHHIAPDVDTERDHVIATLQRAGQLAEVYAVADFHEKREGRNGGGDRWHTDGRLFVGVIEPE
jgi:LssY C-terminus